MSSKSSKALEIVQTVKVDSLYMIIEADRAKGPLETPPSSEGLPESLGRPAIGQTRDPGAGLSQRVACSDISCVGSSCLHLELPWLLTERVVL